MDYLIGDLQGCDEAFGQLLDELDFSPSRDHLVLLGDLVNRGPASAAVLDRVAGLGAAASSLLGNHDLHFLAVTQGTRALHRGDTLQPLLDHPALLRWTDWLRHQHLALRHGGWLCVHAGLAPSWTATQALACAAEVEACLRSTEPGRFVAFLQALSGNTPARWHDDLAGSERQRLIVNVLTRIRYCAADGTLDFKAKEGAGQAPAGLLPWFDWPGRASAGQPIAFGHWSTLGLVNRADLLALDTGCVWGGCLSAARVDGGRRDIHQVRCKAAQLPGA